MKKTNNSLLNYLTLQGKDAVVMAFTLVELIVSITILAILGTIAFISLQGYSSNARDSVRISDVAKLKTSLELFYLDSSKFPNPTDGFSVTYSGGIVWTQGIFGNDTFINIDKLDKIPLDPLTSKEYTYSITNTKQEYQLGGIMESNSVTLNNSNTTFAGERIATAYVGGNYNGQIIKVQTGTTCSIFSLPSIISSKSEDNTDLIEIVTSKSLVYNGFNNLPSNYITSNYKADGGFDFTSNKFVVYQDSQSCSNLYSTSDSSARINLVNGIQQAYKSTIIEGEDSIEKIVNLDLTNTGEVEIIGATIVNNAIGGHLEIPNNKIISDGGETPAQPMECSLTQDQVDTLNQGLSNGDLYAYDSERKNEVTPTTESEWCNDAYVIEWYGGSSVPDGIWNITNLLTLVLDSNLMGSIPESIGNLTNLEALYISDNGLTSLPSGISNLTKLKELSLDSNLFTDIPPQINSLSSLNALYFRDNNISSLSSAIGNFTNLLDLRLSGNSMTTLPSSIGNLTNLSYLEISNNPFTSLPSEIGNLSNLQDLGLAYTSLLSLPVSVCNLYNLTNLNIRYNSFTTLPVEIGNLTNLISLDVSNNSLVTIPNEIGNLTNLLSIDLRWNSLTSLPAGIGNLSKLSTLDLIYNSLTTLPSEIGNLNITSLSLSENNITSLPAEIGNLSSLQSLVIDYNNLTTLPTEITNLTNLTALFLYNNFSLGNLSYRFNPTTPTRSQLNIPTTGKTMSIRGNGSKIVITVTP